MGQIRRIHFVVPLAFLFIFAAVPPKMAYGELKPIKVAKIKIKKIKATKIKSAKIRHTKIKITPIR